MHLLAILIALVAPETVKARPLIVDDGKVNAQIVVCEQPPRAVPVAAKELQTYIRKISGATLSITTTPDDAIPLCIYVGRSRFTDSLGIGVEDLDHGAFRMISGDDWMALVGRDSNYVFKEPYARNLADKDRVQAEWEKITGAKWSVPYGTSPLRYYNDELNLSYQDERGSINAVYRFLTDLGVRWFLPDDMGEVVPHQATLPLPEMKQTVRPDFALRDMYSRARFTTTSEALWAMRMGWDMAPDITGPSTIHAVAHGMTRVGNQPGSRERFPEFFVMLNGKRFMPVKNPSFCLSSEELFQQNVRYLRLVFDTYDPLMVSVQPADGNVLVCQCEKCAGKATPQRGRRGEASDYVWEYIDRVAREVYKTHPNHKIAALAYANYQLPPTNIDTLSPNIIIGVPSGRTFTHNNSEEIELIRRIREQWLAKLSEGSKLTYHYEYFMDTRPGRRTEHLPVFVTGSIARSLREAKGTCIGEHIDLERHRGDFIDLGVMHLNIYITSKLWWDADQDLEALLEDYYTKYYGPAREPMKRLIEYAEAHWTDMPSDANAINTYFDLLAEAQAAAPADSVYARRIELLGQYTQPMEKKIMQNIARGRDESIPPIRVRGPRPPIKTGDITIDGKLDEKAWLNTHAKSTPEHLNLPTYELRDLVTGDNATHATHFKVFWADGALYFGIRCEDPDGANVNITSLTHDDAAIWKGDLVEIHLESQSHSYYALVINPGGTVVDLDWKDEVRETVWNSNAEVATQIDETGWTVEVRIPIVNEMESEIVELGTAGVAGRKPTENFPWYMNLVRQRVREGHRELTAYSPTGRNNFHDPFKFARMY